MSFEFTLTATQQRIAALGLALLPLAGALLFVASLVSDAAEHHARVRLLKAERADYAALIDHATDWKNEIDAFHAASAGAELFYAGNASAAAGPQVVAALSNIVSAHGGTILHASLDGTRPDDGPGVLRASVAFEADIADLTGILHAVGAARPLLFPARLIVRRQDGAAAKGPTRLDVDLAVSGFARTP